jgi:hypothetical protein
VGLFVVCGLWVVVDTLAVVCEDYVELVGVYAHSEFYVGRDDFGIAVSLQNDHLYRESITTSLKEFYGIVKP